MRTDRHKGADWSPSTLGEVLTVIRGVTYKKEHACSDPQKGFVPIIRATNIQQGLVFDELVYVPQECVSEEQMLRRGDIIIAASSGSRHIVGKAAQLTNDWKGSFGAFCFGLRPKAGVDAGFLAWFMQTPEYRNRVSELSAGVNINNLRARHIEETPVRLPALPDQRRIVAEIEKQFTRLDAGVAALRRVQANLKRYRAAVLKAACEGRLVPTEAELARKEGRTYENGEELLQRILAERQRRWGEWNSNRKYSQPTVPNRTSLPSVPHGWTWATLDELLTYLRNGWGLKPDAEAGTPILRINAVRPMSVNLAEVRYLSGKVKDYKDYVLTEGDLLFTRYNGNPNLTGVCGVVPPMSEEIVHPDKLIRVKIIPQLCDPRFVAMVANVGASRDFLARRVRTTAGQTGISGSDLKCVPIPLAPLAEQMRIVAEVERRLSVVEELEALASVNLRRGIRLRQAILQNAFTGKVCGDRS